MLTTPPRCGPPRRTTLPDGGACWLVTRHADARTVLSDPRFVREPARVAALRGLARPRDGGRAATMLHLDAPEHTRVRRSVGPAFTARRAAEHGSLIDELATTLVDRCRGSGRADLVCDLAVPLAVGVLCHVTGLPAGDHARFGPWVRQVHRIDGGAEAGRRTLEAIDALDRYLRERIADDRGVLGEIAGSDRLTEAEVIAIGRDLLVGGYESTANLISGGLALLLAEPDRYARLRRDPGRVDAVVEECLREVAPFPQLEARYAAEAVEVGGTELAPGDAVVVDVAAANHDPDAIGGHLSFGYGAHHCLGAALARREARAAFRAVRAFDDLRLGCAPGDLAWEPGLSPALRALPVRFTPGARA